MESTPKKSKRMGYAKDDEVNPSGRPLREIELTEVQIKHILKLYNEGASDVEVKGYLVLQFDSFSNPLWVRLLEDTDSIFSVTIKTGRMLSANWWENQGRIALRDGKFNSTLWYMNMRNRFGWADKTEEKLTVEDRRKSINDLFPEVDEA